jgi:DNA-binding transcriptional ArsR family regulator
MLLPKLLDTYTVESPVQASALLNPLRAEIVAKLIEPASAAEIARQINETPQKVNYHLKTLEKVGLVQRTGTRQVKNLVEILYQAIAKTYILSESLGLNSETVQRIKDQGSLNHLITTADRMRRDALLLMERSDENEIIPSASLSMKIHLETEEKRNSFVKEYVAAVKELAAKYQRDSSEETYNVLIAVYPEANETNKGGD